MRTPGLVLILFLAALIVCAEMIPKEELIGTNKSIILPIIQNQTVALDGNLAEAVWNQAATQQAFIFPWNEEETPATQFYAFTDGNMLYFAFRVQDEDVVLTEAWEGESTVMEEDRVEFFIAGSKRLEKYYGVEIDPLGRVMDYQASYYRHFDYAWNLQGLETKGTLTESGYIVEGKVPLKSLKNLDGVKTEQGTEYYFGLYRGEFSHGKDGAIIYNGQQMKRKLHGQPSTAPMSMNLRCLSMRLRKGP